MYKKILISILMFSFLIISCGNSKLNNEERKIINKVKSEVKEFKKNPSKEKAEELFKKGEIQNEKRNYEIAKMYYEGASEFVPMANYHLAILYRKKGSERKYIEYIKKASDKGVLNASKDISRYYQEKGEFDKSIDYRMKVVEQGDESWSDFIILDYVIGRKENKLKGNEREKIIKFFEKEGEKNYKVREWFANFYRIEGSYEEAEKIYMRMEKENYENAEFLLGDFYSEQGKYSEAEKYYLKGIEKHGRKLKLLFGLAAVYKEQGRYKEAKEIYEGLKNFKDESIKELAEKNLKELERENNYE